MANVTILNNTRLPMPIGPYLIVPATRWNNETGARTPGYIQIDQTVVDAINALDPNDSRRRNLGFCSVLSDADLAANPWLIQSRLG